MHDINEFMFTDQCIHRCNSEIKSLETSCVTLQTEIKLSYLLCWFIKDANKNKSFKRIKKKTSRDHRHIHKNKLILIFLKQFGFL